MQQSRRSNPYPWTWEIPALVFAVVGLLMSMAVHAARAIANAAAGGGWHLTPRASLFRSLPRLLGGDAAAGLPTKPPAVATGTELWVWIVVTQLVVVIAMGVILRIVLRQWGTGRVQGMASPSEADQLLGISRLRRNAHIIRPDLYGKRTS